MALTKFEEAKAKFEAAGADTGHDVKGGPCTELVALEGEVVRCGAPIAALETFRGSSYRIAGKCANGHVLERYGYASEVSE